MTIRELNRAYRAAGVSSPFRVAWLSPLALGVLIAFWPGMEHRAGGLSAWMFLPFIALVAATFLPRAFTPAQHTMAWTYGLSRSRLVLVNVLSMAATAAIVGVSAGAAARALVWLRWNPPEWTTRSLTGDVLLCSSIPLALVGWLMAMAGTYTSRLVPVQYRLSGLSEYSGFWDWIKLLWRVPVMVLFLGAIHAPLAYALYRLGVIPGCLLVAAVTFPTAFLLTVTSECRVEQGWMAPPRPRQVRREVLRRHFGPVRALFWTQSPPGACALALVPLGLAVLVVAICVPEISLPRSIEYLPCLINMAWLAYPIGHSRQAAALYAWGLDLRRQARILLCSFLGGSTATILLGLGLALRWGEGRDSEKILRAISLWSVQLIFLVPWPGKWLVVGAGWLLVVFWSPFGNLRPEPTMACLLALAAAVLLVRAWRASADESALKERLFFTSPAPWAAAFLGRGARRGASRRARRPSPGG